MFEIQLFGICLFGFPVKSFCMDVLMFGLSLNFYENVINWLDLVGADLKWICGGTCRGWCLKYFVINMFTIAL